MQELAEAILEEFAEVLYLVNDNCWQARAVTNRLKKEFAANPSILIERLVRALEKSEKTLSGPQQTVHQSL